MSAIAIPFAPLWAKIVCGIPLALITLFGLRWAGGNLWLSLKILHGIAPPPSGSTKTVSGTLGLVFHSLVVMLALGTGYFLCALLTTQPTLVTDSGVVIGAGPPNYRARFMAWREVSSVQCGMPYRSNVIARLVVRSDADAVELGSLGVPLEPVRAFIGQHVPAGTLSPCRHERTGRGFTF